MKKLFNFRKYPTYIHQLWWRLTIPIFLYSKNLHLGKNVKFYGCPIITTCKNSSIKIGSNSVLCSNSNYTALGINHAVVVRTMDENAKIEIGEDCGFSGSTICAATHIIIGDKVMLGANVTVIDTDFHSLDIKKRRYSSVKKDVKTKKIQIGNNVFIGANCIILKGSQIGDNSVIGAGSIVRGEIPANSIASGNPVQILKSINDENY